MRMDKIKISISKITLDLLKKDCKDFNILKKDKSPNFNMFINLLLTNYYDEFSAMEENLHNNIYKAIDAAPSRIQETLFQNIIKMLSAKPSSSAFDKTTTFSFKPTKTSENVVLYIDNILVKDESLSSFYRRLFTSYASKTKNLRELIIHKENYLQIQKAIKKHLKIAIKLKTGDYFVNVSVYAISHSKDELFNYALLYLNKRNSTIRLSSIDCVTLLSEKSDIPVENIKLFNIQLENDVQYTIYNTDDEPVKVKLTDKGKKLFEKIYLYRPTPISIEGDIYTFHCSAQQILFYFERFGDNAIILSPKKLGIFMRNYYYYSYKSYKKLYYKD